MPTVAARLAIAQERLAAVEASIARAQEAQQYAAEGRSMVRGDLQALYSERDRLEATIARCERALSGRSRGFVGVPL